MATSEGYVSYPPPSPTTTLVYTLALLSVRYCEPPRQPLQGNYYNPPALQFFFPVASQTFVSTSCAWRHPPWRGDGLGTLKWALGHE